MNKIILMGRLTRDPDVKYSQEGKAYARFSLAVDRRYKKEGGPTADFFNCTAFGKTAEFCEKYLRKGTKILLDGELQNNNYTNQEGQTVYSMQILVNSLEFAESKRAADENQQQANQNPADPPAGGDFMDIPDVDESELPFA